MTRRRPVTDPAKTGVRKVPKSLHIRNTSPRLLTIRYTYQIWQFAVDSVRLH